MFVAYSVLDSIKLGLLDVSHVKGIRGFIKLLFQSLSSTYGNTPPKYYCMSFGNEHNEISCPKCGSKMKRVD